MIKLLSILREVVEDLEVPQDAYTGKVYSNSPNVWTHVSKHDGVIEDIKKKRKWISRDEDLAHFVYGTDHLKGKRFSLSKDNKSSIYMKKGALYVSEPSDKYPLKWLVTTDLPDDASQHCFGIAKRIANAQKNVLHCDRVALIIAGFEVPHCHLHVIPATTIADVSFDNAASSVDFDDLAAVAASISAALS